VGDDQLVNKEGLMRNEKLLQYIASLSDEEREKFRDLIEETLQRDRALEQNCNAMTLYLENFVASFHLLKERVLQLQGSLSELNDTLMEVRDASQMLSGLESRRPVWN
jgi:lipid II:glycine glycyltransferase (peptidoglycan interpeptide bridge formation enzyme)